METRGKFLEQLRLAKGWKKRPPLVAALAKEGVKITAEAIRQYETDKARPSGAIRAGLAKVYGVSEEAIEFGKEQPRAGRGAELSPREEIIVELFRGYLDPQQKELLAEMRAMFFANQMTRRELGVKELKGVSNERVREAFGDVPPPKKPKMRKRPPHRGQDNAHMGDTDAE